MYPTFDIHEAETIIKFLYQAIQDPIYLAQSPYDVGLKKQIEEIVALLNPVTILKEEKNPVGRPKGHEVMQVNEVEEEMAQIRTEIGQLKIDAVGLQTADRIQIVKTRAALVEKIISLKERTTNLREQEKFKAVMLGIMEDIMEQPQREQMLKRLEGLI